VKRRTLWFLLALIVVVAFILIALHGGAADGWKASDDSEAAPSDEPEPTHAEAESDTDSDIPLDENELPIIPA
jgi:hypothetical protein